MEEKIDNERIVQELQKRWSWIPDWKDESDTSAGGLVAFSTSLQLSSIPIAATLYCSADTRYKLEVNGVRTAIGPTRGCDRQWYYDTIDIVPYLRAGHNDISIDVLRLYPGKQTGHAFARTRLPGLTLWGSAVLEDGSRVDLSIGGDNWMVSLRDISLPFGEKEDCFLHIFERARLSKGPSIRPVRYDINTRTGEIPPWDLYPRITPFAEERDASALELTEGDLSWNHLSSGSSIHLHHGTHKFILRAPEYLTAFLRIDFEPSVSSSIEIKYAECFEREPKVYPWLRVKGDRLEPGLLLGPRDIVDLSQGGPYEPFWYRAFRFLEITVKAGPEGVTLNSLSLTQTNYPLSSCGTWQSSSKEMNDIWTVSVRTLRNCLFDGVSDCPFYEQLQYAEDTRSSRLFHYCISGDDRLMRQAIIAFANSINPDGLTQSRYPSHVQQVIPGFSLFWILQVCDHFEHFADGSFTHNMIPAILMVLGFFRRHIDSRGLVSGISSRYWQFVDWAASWQGTATHDGGTPAAGRGSNTYTFASILLCYTSRRLARVLDCLQLSSIATDCNQLSDNLESAINANCYDGQYYLDSTIDQDTRISQHCQIFAVLAGVCSSDHARRVVIDSLDPDRFAQCSYVLQHYVFRALSMTGLYERFWSTAWEPWRKMLANNLSTWEEDTVTQRSDCHAWGCAALYEYVVELAGLHNTGDGWKTIEFRPRVGLVEAIDLSVPCGADNSAHITWRWEGGKCVASLELKAPAHVKTWQGALVDHGMTRRVEVTVHE